MGHYKLNRFFLSCWGRSVLIYIWDPFNFCTSQDLQPFFLFQEFGYYPALTQGVYIYQHRRILNVLFILAHVQDSRFLFTFHNPLQTTDYKIVLLVMVLSPNQLGLLFFARPFQFFLCKVEVCFEFCMELFHLRSELSSEVTHFSSSPSIFSPVCIFALSIAFIICSSIVFLAKLLYRSLLDLSGFPIRRLSQKVASHRRH